MQDPARNLFLNILETILQNRVAVNKKQMAQFNEVNQQIKRLRAKAYGGDLNTLLSRILLQEKFGLRHKIQLTNEFESATILFKLVARNKEEVAGTKEVIDGEIWTIEFQQFHELGDDLRQQEFGVIISVFEELLMFLNQQPLFCLYRRDTFLRNNYDLVHEIRIGAEQTHSHAETKDLILNLRQKYVMERACGSFLLHIFCYLCPSFDDDDNKKPLIPSKYENKPFQPENQSTDSKSRKSSVFEYYDHDLDFMFLSSEEENFNKGKTNTIDLTGYIDDDQFEMLVAGEDEGFLTDNKNQLAELASLEETYYNQAS